MRKERITHYDGAGKGGDLVRWPGRKILVEFPKGKEKRTENGGKEPVGTR